MADLCSTCGAYWECDCPDWVIVEEAGTITPAMAEWIQGALGRLEHSHVLGTIGDYEINSDSEGWWSQDGILDIPPPDAASSPT